MTQPYARLELPTVDYGGSIGTKSDVAFEFVTSAEGQFVLGEEIRTGYILNNQFSNVLGFIASVIDADEELREGVFLDAGGGEHAWNIQFQSPGERIKPGTDGDDFQWGSSINPSDGPNEHTATGAGALAQQAVFMHALEMTTIDSRRPAVFSYGEWSESGFLHPRNVVIEEPSTDFPNTSNHPDTFNASFNLVAVKDLSEPVDAALKPP